MAHKGLHLKFAVIVVMDAQITVIVFLYWSRV